MNRGVFSRLIVLGRGDGLRAQLLRGGMGVGALQILFLPLSFTVTILLARGLGSEGFGQYTFVITLITILSIPLAPALMQLAVRETATMHQSDDDDGIRKLLRWANRYVLFISGMMILAAGGLALQLAEWRADDRWTLLLIASLALPLLGLNAVRSGVLAGLRRVAWGHAPDLLVRPLGILLVASPLAIAGILTPLTAVVAFVTGAALAFIVGTIVLQRVFPKTIPVLPKGSSAQSWQWCRALMPFTLLVAASTLNGHISILLLGWLSTPEEVAAMRVATQGAMLVALSLTVVNLVIGPHITRVYQSGDRAKLQKLSRYSAGLALLIALPIALPIIFFGGPILELVFGMNYAEIATLPLVILTIGQLINVGFGSVGLLLIMSGYERDTLLGQIIALIVTMAAATVLIIPLGAVGAALATATGILVWNGILAVVVFRRLSIIPSSFSFGK